VNVVRRREFEMMENKFIFFGGDGREEK